MAKGNKGRTTNMRNVSKSNKKQNSPKKRSTNWFNPSLSGQCLKGKCFVIDGDTLIIKRQKIRLFGINAPEVNTRYGRAAKWYLHHICNKKIITATFTGQISYGRKVAVCTLPDGSDIAICMSNKRMAKWA